MDYKERLQILDNKFQLLEELKTENFKLKEQLENKNGEIALLRLKHRSELEKAKEEVAEQTEALQLEKDWLAQQIFDEYNGKEQQRKIHSLSQEVDRLSEEISSLYPGVKIYSLFGYEFVLRWPLVTFRKGNK